MADYLARFKDRFVIQWRRLIPLMIIYYIFDLLFRTTSGHFYEINTIITYVSVPIVTAIVATMLVILTKIFYNPIGMTFLFFMTVVFPYYSFGWWGVIIGLIIFALINWVFMSGEETPSYGIGLGGGGSSSYEASSSSVDEDYIEEQKRQDEWNNSAEKHARDYDQWRSHN